MARRVVVIPEPHSRTTGPESVGWHPGISIFKQSPQVILEHPNLRTTASGPTAASHFLKTERPSGGALVYFKGIFPPHLPFLAWDWTGRITFSWGGFWGICEGGDSWANDTCIFGDGCKGIPSTEKWRNKNVKARILSACKGHRGQVTWVDMPDYFQLYTEKEMYTYGHQVLCLQCI